MYYDNRKNVSDLIGKTISKIEKDDNNENLIIETTDNKKYRMYHQQDCCESVYLEDVVGNLDDLVGSPLVKAEEVTSNDNPEGVDVPEYQESFTWTFYHFTTQRGDDVTLRWYGESNGYYSESVDFIEINEGKND